MSIPALFKRPSRGVAVQPVPPSRSGLYLTATAAIVGALSLAALVNRQKARKAERDNPPPGRFIDVDGVRLHFVEQGSGMPLVLLHGNGSMVEDFTSSGLIDEASREFRVIAFDRPGFGHSARPRRVVWTPDRQADLLLHALRRVGVSEAVVLGHSWGASVAIAVALKDPALVRGLVLASGYYYPTARADVLGLSAPAIPVIGDILANTVAPVLSRLIWARALAKMFSPATIPEKFKGFPKEMALRPSQLRASAAETAMMIPDAFHFKDKYGSLTMPVTIVVGAEDQLVDPDAQSARLHEDIRGSRFHRAPGSGHMVHQTATGEVISAIYETMAAVREACPADADELAEADGRASKAR